VDIDAHAGNAYDAHLLYAADEYAAQLFLKKYEFDNN